jgi:hypothetical protein
VEGSPANGLDDDGVEEALMVRHQNKGAVGGNVFQAFHIEAAHGIEKRLQQGPEEPVPGHGNAVLVVIP